MTEYTLHLRKMKTSLDHDNNACYQLHDINMNDLLGKVIKLEFLNEINCVACGRLTKKSFSQGYCFPCMRSLPECDTCIVKPELCHFHAGTCRDSNWGSEHCIKPHFIYLANTAKAKVGITREKNTPSRWIDQGAVQALPIIKVSERLLSGLIEVRLAKHLADKTNWQAMLKEQPDAIDLLRIKNKILLEEGDFIASLKAKYGTQAIELMNSQTIEIHYPVLSYPQKVSSHNLDKNLLVEGTLLGIKGQYIMLDTGVMNMRKFTGYKCRLTISE
ncbi:DUF2797 domain-containing protein [Cysteiniphilum halobium]|uniref:DUF2797 domain-containing protein n=1 Tax=Cysteiniphilum halobium TaxID=2219059 RepID=UPI003F847FF0